MVDHPWWVTILGLVADRFSKGDGCTFKRGGKCVTHGCMGERYSTTEKKWVKKKDGTFGWKYMKRTKYKCQNEGVPTSNRCNSGLESEEQTNSSLGTGDDAILSGTDYGISGVGITGLKSESDKSG